MAEQMENKFAEGSTVYAIATPEIQLTVRRYVERVYYCKVAHDLDHKELIYFERELTPSRAASAQSLFK